jgi:hypothetical protein
MYSLQIISRLLQLSWLLLGWLLLKCKNKYYYITFVNALTFVVERLI